MTQHPFFGVVASASPLASSDRRTFFVRVLAAVAGLGTFLLGRSAAAQYGFDRGYGGTASGSFRGGLGGSTFNPPRTTPSPSTRALGEEGGGGTVTTFAVGEEGGGGTVTTYAIGEEGSGGTVTTFAVGEEGGRYPTYYRPVYPPPRRYTTYATGEEGGYYYYYRR